jgi:hypothetical protein
MQFTMNPVFFTSGSRKLFHSFTVFQSCYENLPNDEQSKAFATPDFPRYSMCHGHMNAVNLHNTSSTLNPQPGAAEMESHCQPAEECEEVLIDAVSMQMDQFSNRADKFNCSLSKSVICALKADEELRFIELLSTVGVH